MSLIRLVQWLSTAFVTVMAISWVAVGHPGTTTELLWSVQDIITDGAQSIADQSDPFLREVEGLRQQEQNRARKIEEEDSFIEGWRTETRPLGELPEDGWW